MVDVHHHHADILSGPGLVEVGDFLVDRATVQEPGKRVVVNFELFVFELHSALVGEIGDVHHESEQVLFELVKALRISALQANGDFGRFVESRIVHRHGARLDKQVAERIVPGFPIGDAGRIPSVR